MSQMGLGSDNQIRDVSRLHCDRQPGARTMPVRNPGRLGLAPNLSPLGRCQLEAGSDVGRLCVAKTSDRFFMVQDTSEHRFGSKVLLILFNSALKTISRTLVLPSGWILIRFLVRWLSSSATCRRTTASLRSQVYKFYFSLLLPQRASFFDIFQFARLFCFYGVASLFYRTHFLFPSVLVSPKQQLADSWLVEATDCWLEWKSEGNRCGRLISFQTHLNDLDRRWGFGSETAPYSWKQNRAETRNLKQRRRTTLRKSVPPNGHVIHFKSPIRLH